MSDPIALQHELQSLIGQEVILDVKGYLIYIGTLQTIGRDVVVLTNADVHFRDDSQTTCEVYLLETKRNGVRPNRGTVYVMRDEVVSISRLEDVILY